MRIKSIKKTSKQQTFDLRVENNHNYFVGEQSSILVHNSGKDSSKQDRTGAYAMRYIAKNLIAQEAMDGADCCQTQVSYAIGKKEPCSFRIKFNDNSFDRMNEKKIRKLEEKVLSSIDLRPRALVERFELEKPIFYPTARNGHFGVKPYTVGNLNFYTWEQLNLSL